MLLAVSWCGRGKLPVTVGVLATGTVTVASASIPCTASLCLHGPPCHAGCRLWCSGGLAEQGNAVVCYLVSLGERPPSRATYHKYAARDLLFATATRPRGKKSLLKESCICLSAQPTTLLSHSYSHVIIFKCKPGSTLGVIELNKKLLFFKKVIPQVSFSPCHTILEDPYLCLTSAAPLKQSSGTRYRFATSSTLQNRGLDLVWPGGCHPCTQT